MKRFLGIVLFITLLLMNTLFSAESTARTLISLDDFIARYNKLMVEIEYQATYGIDAYLTNDDIFIKPGEVNDTAQVFLPDYQGGAIQLNFVKNTRYIKEIWLFLITRGPNKAPERLLELFGGLVEGAGAVKEGSDIVEVMYNLGLYKPNAFEVDKEASILSNGINIGYRIMTFQSDLFLVGYATPE